MDVIDIHTHAFPDALAERAMPQLEHEGKIKAALDGKIASLVRSMDEAGVSRSVVCSIATKPEQFGAILKWSTSIASDRLLPFPSVHPDDPQAVERVELVRAEGFRGLKLHPYYQNFLLDEERLFPIYEAIQRCNLVALLHTGFDIAFERIRRGDPVRIMSVLRSFPNLKLVTTHFGAWEDWDESRRHLLGRPVYMDPSMSIGYMSREVAKEFLTNHPQEYLVFGTDSPWSGQLETIEAIRSFKLGDEREEHLFHRNSERLLGEAPRRVGRTDQ